MPAALRPVRISATSLFCPAGIDAAGAAPGQAGAVPGFKARAFIPDRKSIKLMSRSVQLGVAAVRAALEHDGEWQSVVPERRALFVGASPQAGDAGDLGPALALAWTPSGEFDIGRFADEGIDRIHPLWLVRGLSNNVLGFASANHNMQGVNRNYCDGVDGGWTAIVEAWWSIAEGRADIAVAGGVDSLVGAEAILDGKACGEGAAFVVFRATDNTTPSDGSTTPPSRKDLTDPTNELGILGAATWPIALVRALHNHNGCKDSAND